MVRATTPKAAIAWLEERRTAAEAGFAEALAAAAFAELLPELDPEEEEAGAAAGEAPFAEGADEPEEEAAPDGEALEELLPAATGFPPVRDAKPPPVQPSREKWPVNARSGEVPNSRASIYIKWGKKRNECCVM